LIDGLSTLILVLGFGDDLRSRKIHNALVVGLLLLSILIIFTARGASGLGYGFGCALLGAVLMYPLVHLKAMGAGDMKLFAVFSFTSDPTTVMYVYGYSLIAGAAIGLVKATLSGGLFTVLNATALLAIDGKNKPTGDYNIPYSAALLLGWLAFASMNQWELWS
jgi:Flp pilus assembly protein protease CpaA